MVQSRLVKVSNFFSNDNYLKNSFNIELRKSIIKEQIGKNYEDNLILDIGCGDGSLSLPFILKNKVYLIDSSEFMIEKAKSTLSKTTTKFPPQVINGDFLSYNFGVRFNLILCIGVVSHITDVDALLLKIKELLCNNGVAIVQISDSSHPRYEKAASGIKEYGYKLNRTNKSQFVRKLSELGFVVTDIKGYSWTFFPINRLRQDLQFKILNGLRKSSFFNFLSSEWLLLVTKK